MGKKKSKILPLTHALAYIVVSTLLVSGTSYALFKRYLKTQNRYAKDPQFAIRSIIQTGPQKEALKTEYLAELLELSSDRLFSAPLFDLGKAKQRLLISPLISQVDVKLIKSNTLYVDYTVRQPIAWLEDYHNIVIDKEGYPFPFSPFFSPKNLPSLYFGLPAFGMPAVDPDRPTAQFRTPLQGKYVTLALDILTIVNDPKVADLFSVKRIDVSNAFAESYGTREIVVITEDSVIQQIHGKEVQFLYPRILRLSHKNYAQELGNYLKLRQQLLEEEKKNTPSEALGDVKVMQDFESKSCITLPSPTRVIRCKEKIIDFRIQKLAFIEEQGRILKLPPAPRNPL